MQSDIRSDGKCFWRTSKYSQVSTKRVYLINEYRGKSQELLNEYDLINEYEGKFHKIDKRVWPNKQVLCTLKFLINVGTLIIIGMRIFCKIDNRRHLNRHRHAPF